MYNSVIKKCVFGDGKTYSFSYPTTTIRSYKVELFELWADDAFVHIRATFIIGTRKLEKMMQFSVWQKLRDFLEASYL